MHDIQISPDVLARSAARRGGQAHPFLDSLDPARTAHLVVDLQNGFMAQGALVEVPMARAIVPTVNAISAALRDAGGLNAFLRITVAADDAERWSTFYRAMMPEAVGDANLAAFSPGDPAWAFWPELDIRDGDLVVDKARFSAFVQGSSSLHDALQARGIDTVIVTGTLTNCCCECTARDAMQLNYRVLFVADATAALSDAAHNATLANMCEIFADVVTAAEVTGALSAASGRAAAE